MLNSVILLVAVVLFIISNTAEGGRRKDTAEECAKVQFLNRILFVLFNHFM